MSSEISDVNDEFYDHCQRKNFTNAQDMLDQYKYIDIIYENGDCLHFAAKYKNTDMMEALLKYFYEVQLPQIDNQYLRKDTENKLKENLDDVESSWVITEEIEQVINKYVNPKEEARLDDLDNNSELSLNKELANKVIHRDFPEKSNELDKTADTSRGSPESNKSGKSVFSLDTKIDMNYAKNVMNHYHLDSSFHDFSKINTYNDDFSIDYGAYFSQQIHNTCLGNFDASTQDNSPERELSGEYNANTNITEFV